MKLLVINGVNLNMLGIREPDLYGKKDYKALVKEIEAHAKSIGVKVTCVRKNIPSCTSPYNIITSSNTISTVSCLNIIYITSSQIRARKICIC